MRYQDLKSLPERQEAAKRSRWVMERIDAIWDEMKKKHPGLDNFGLWQRCITVASEDYEKQKARNA